MKMNAVQLSESVKHQVTEHLKKSSGDAIREAVNQQIKANTLATEHIILLAEVRRQENEKSE
jgi:hypothetical protein